MSRNSQSFHQLLNYLDREERNRSFTWNLYSNNNYDLVKEYLDNAQHLKNSRGSIYLYHEVISLEKNNLNSKEIETLLYDLASHYISARANNHLVYGSIHLDTNNPHIHLMISANAINSSKRLRLSKHQFKTVQSKLESYKNDKYPQLESSHNYSVSKDPSNPKQSEGEMKHKRKKQTQKEYVKENLQRIFHGVASKSYLNNSLSKLNFELYARGDTIGVIYEGKKYRLKTLGVDELYHKYLKQIERVEAREQKRQEFKDSKSKSHENNYSR